MIKILLVATVVSSFMIDEIGQITNFDSSQISTVAVLMVELVFVFGAHSWVRSLMMCLDTGHKKLYLLVSLFF